MFSFKSYLLLGEYTGANFVTLAREGYELINTEFSLEQGIDTKGEPSTSVYGGTISIILPTFPSKELSAWMLNSRSYKQGAIVSLDNQNIPQDKIFFKNAACVRMSTVYARKGKSLFSTTLVIRAEELYFGNNVDFCNFWTN